MLEDQESDLFVNKVLYYKELRTLYAGKVSEKYNLKSEIGIVYLSKYLFTAVHEKSINIVGILQK